MQDVQCSGHVGSPTWQRSRPCPTPKCSGPRNLAQRGVPVGKDVPKAGLTFRPVRPANREKGRARQPHQPPSAGSGWAPP